MSTTGLIDPQSTLPLAVDTASGLLQPVRYRGTDHCDDRPSGVMPELIVIHGISLPPGEFGGPWIDALFTNRLPTPVPVWAQGLIDLRVSAHLLIRRDGEVIQYVPFHRRAWHAGVSCYRGRVACNDFSIGIELEGCDHIPYEAIQYQRLASIITALIAAYPGLSRDRLAGHADIAPGRKTDPGPAFQWRRLIELLREGEKLGKLTSSKP